MSTPRSEILEQLHARLAPESDEETSEPEGEDLDAEDETEETMEEDGEPSGDEESEEEEPSEDADTDDEEVSDDWMPSTVDELAEALSKPLDEVMESLKLEWTAPDGTKEQITLNEAKRGGMREADYTRKTQELSSQRAQAESELTAKEKQLEERFYVVGHLLQSSEQQLKREYEAIDWNGLRAEDEGRYSAKRLEFQERVRGIQESRQRAIQAYTQHQQSQEAAKQQRRQEKFASEQQKLIAWKGELADPMARESYGREQVAFLTEMLGEDISQLYGEIEDHRLFKIFHYAKIGYEAEKGATKTVETVKQAPRRRLRPGRQTNPRTEKSTEVKRAEQLAGRRDLNRRQSQDVGETLIGDRLRRAARRPARG